MLAGLGKSGPALVHHVVVCKRDDLDPIGLQPIEQGNGSIEQEGLRPMRMSRGHGCLQVHKAEVGLIEDVAHIAEQRAPSPCAVTGGSRGSTHRFMRNHIPGHGKADLCKLMRIRNDHGSKPAPVRPSQERPAHRSNGQQQCTSAGHKPAPAQALHEPCA